MSLENDFFVIYQAKENIEFLTIHISKKMTFAYVATIHHEYYI
jgi:hypothetical protein